jgi:hypothetical protein
MAEQKQEAEKQKQMAEIKDQEEKRRDELSRALSEGDEYIGVVSHPRSGSRTRVAFKVVSREGMLITIAAQNPDDPAEKRSFNGEIKALAHEEQRKRARWGDEPDEEAELSQPRRYAVMLSPANKGTYGYKESQEKRWAFWLAGGGFGLVRTPTGALTGDGEFNGQIGYDFRYEFSFEPKKNGKK